MLSAMECRTCREFTAECVRREHAYQDILDKIRLHRMFDVAELNKLRVSAKSARLAFEAASLALVTHQKIHAAR
jgi:hypothetical protein